MHDCGKNKRLLNMTVMHNGVGTCSTLASTDPKDAMHLPSQYSTDRSGCATSNFVCAKKITICGTPTPVSYSSVPLTWPRYSAIKIALMNTPASMYTKSM